MFKIKVMVKIMVRVENTLKIMVKIRIKSMVKLTVKIMFKIREVVYVDAIEKPLNDKIKHREDIIKKLIEVVELSACNDVYIGSFNCKVSTLKRIRNKARSILNDPEIIKYRSEK